jgi:hypothetical protein
MSASDKHVTSNLLRQALLIASSLLTILSTHASHAGCLPSSAVPSKVRDARVVVLGEIHGTAEAPSFAGDLLCLLARDGGRVVLALEIPSDQQPEIDAYVSGGSKAEFIRSAMASRNFWARNAHDGRSSKAMLGLIEQVRALRTQGLPVTILAFDQAPSQYGPEVLRDEVMAENLRASIVADPEAMLLVLVGSVHAAKSVGTSFDPQYLPAINILREERLVSLQMTHSGGDAWACFGSTIQDLDCGPKTLRPTAPDRHGKQRITLDSRLLPAFDGYFTVKHVTASPPAIDSQTN